MLRIEAGAPARARWRHAENLPFNLVLLYRGTDVLTIRTVSFTRLK